MITRVFSFLLPFLFSFSLASAQNVSQVAFVAFNADGGDDFAFVTLNTISANTTIYLSDNEILNDSSLSAGEGILAWSNINSTPAGTVIIVNGASSSSSITVNIGNAQRISGNFNLSASGDALIAYQGPTENKVSHWLSAIENSANEAGNINSTNLIQNQCYIQFNQTTSPDGGYYQGPRNGEANFGAYKTLIQDATNWQEDVSNGLSILPISSSSFTTTGSSLAQLLMKSFSNSIDTIAQQGDAAHQISAFKVKALNGSTSILDISLAFSGNYAASDFDSFQLRTSNGDFSNSTLLKNASADSLINDSLNLSNLNLTLSSGDSLVLHLLARLDSNAAINHNFQLRDIDFTLSQGQSIDSTHNSFLHHIIALKPELVFNSPNFSVRNDTLAQGIGNHPIHSFQLESRFKPVNLVSLNADLQGNLSSADIDEIKLWTSQDTSFNPLEDQLIAATNFMDSSGTIQLTAINYSLTKNNTENFFISLDLSCSAQVARSFRVSSIDSSHIKFDRDVETIGSVNAGASIFIKELATPSAKDLNYQLQGSNLSVSWINPDCIDETLVFIHNQVFSDSISGQYNVNSNSISDSLNDSLVDGAKAVYAGLASATMVTGLSAGQNYYCSLFTRNGTKWSRAQSFNFFLANDPALIISQYYEGQSNDKWIEITNVGDTAIDLSSFYLARWSNTSVPNASATSSNQLSGLLSSGSSILMQHSSAAKPLYASGTSGGSLAFNGNDALAICRNSAEWENRIDCIYSNGIWGENTSFYRKAWVLSPNRDISVLDGTGEWIEVPIGQVDTVSLGISARLGEHESALPSGDFTFNGSIWLPQDPEGLSTTQNSIVIQSGSATFNANVDCSFLQILNQARLEITNGSCITIEDSLINDGEINLSDNALILQKDTTSLNPNSGHGSYSIKKVYQATAVDRFKFWSSPLGDALIESCFSNTNPSDRYYFHSGGHNSGYRSFTAGTMQAGRVYAITPNMPVNLNQLNFSDSVVFQGDTLNNGEIRLSIDSLNPGDYIFLGNPYPSPIDFNLFLAENPNLNASVWYWDASPNDKTNSAFAVWNNQGAVAVGNSKKASPSNIIPAMQGFIVRAGQNIGTLSQYNFIFKNSMRVASGSTNLPFFKSTSSNLKIRLRLRSQKAESFCLISSDSNATEQFDENYDAPIYKANQNQSFYSLAEQRHLSIQSLDLKLEAVDIVPLGIDAWHAGNYTIILDTSSILDSNVSIILVDSLNSFERDLKSQAYSFQISQVGIDTSRFFLKIGQESLSNIATENNELSSIEVFQNSAGNIELNLSDLSPHYDEVQLLNLNSQLLEKWSIEPEQKRYSLPLSESRRGLFLLNLYSDKGRRQSLKIYLYP